MAGEIIRPKDLPPKPDINPNARIAADDETRVWGPTIAEAVGQARPFATQPQAAAGTSTTATMNPLTTKQSIASEVGVSLASKAQGDKADSAVQPGELSMVATTGAYDDLTGKPALGTAAATDATAYATAAQGGKAETALQSVVPGLNVVVDNTDPRNPIVSASGGAGGGVPSRAWAIANLHPAAAPDSLRTDGYASAGDGGGALYKKVASEPSHAGKFSITLADAVTVVWYEIAEARLTPKMLGAPGGTGSNQYQSLVDTIIAATSTRATIDGLGETFRTDAAVDLAGVPIRNITIDGRLVSESVAMDGLSVKAITYRKGPSLHTTTTSLLTAQGNPTNIAVNVANGALFAAGDVVLFWCSTAFDAEGSKVSEWKRVRSVSGNSLQLDSPLMLTYALAAGAKVCKLSAAYTQRMENVTVQGATGAGANQYGFWGEYLHEPYFDDCKFRGCEGGGLTCAESFAPRIPSLLVSDSNQDGYGYSLNIVGCGSPVVGHVIGINCRHVITTGAGGGRSGGWYILSWFPEIASVQGPSSYGAIFDSHPGTVGGHVGSVMGDLRAYSGEDAVMIQGVNFHIGHIDVSGDVRNAFAVQYFGSLGVNRPYYKIGHLGARVGFSTSGVGRAFSVQNLSGAFAQEIGLFAIDTIQAATLLGGAVYAENGSVNRVKIGAGSIVVASGDGLLFRTYSGTAWVKRAKVECDLNGPAVAGTYGINGLSAIASGGRIYPETIVVTGFGHSFRAADMLIRRNDASGAGWATGETSISGGGTIVSIAAS